ncbi:MAG: thioredoxin family protein [Bacteroidetes bacterium]|nr:thioredoxin family protein [Bacteroidota bacterium]
MKKISKFQSYGIVALTMVAGLLMSFAPGKSYKIGDSVADFKLKNTENGKYVSMASFPNAKGYIVVFTCNHCPFAKKYEQRIMDLDKKYASVGYPVIAISPNDPAVAPEDSYDELGKRAKEKGYTFPYTFDETQTVAQAFGATKTPHVFLINKEGGKLILKYAGAIDDNTEDAAKVTKNYLADAIAEVMAGKAVTVTETKSVGCTIKWKQS